MKIIGPIPLNFDDAITDRVVNSLLDHARLTNYYRVCYLGTSCINMRNQAVDHTIPSRCINNWQTSIPSSTSTYTETTTAICSHSIVSFTLSFKTKLIDSSKAWIRHCIRLKSKSFLTLCSRVETWMLQSVSPEDNTTFSWELTRILEDTSNGTISKSKTLTWRKSRSISSISGRRRPSTSEAWNPSSRQPISHGYRVVSTFPSVRFHSVMNSLSSIFQNLTCSSNNWVLRMNSIVRHRKWSLHTVFRIPTVGCSGCSKSCQWPWGKRRWLSRNHYVSLWVGSISLSWP